MTRLDQLHGTLNHSLGWAGRKWIAKAELLHNNQPSTKIHGTKEVEFVNGVAKMDNVRVDMSGSNFQLKFTVYTEPKSDYELSETSAKFSVQPSQKSNTTRKEGKTFNFVKTQ